MYPHPRIASFINEHFVPVRVHARRQPDEFKRLGARYGAQWTPTTLIIDASGAERHRIEGFLPVEDYLAQLKLGLGHSAFARGEYAEAERWFRETFQSSVSDDAKAEALYWVGVAKYKATGNASALAETAGEFREHYQNTPWAKKASVWAA